MLQIVLSSYTCELELIRLSRVYCKAGMEPALVPISSFHHPDVWLCRASSGPPRRGRSAFGEPQQPGGKLLLLLLREAVSCCCCCPVFAKNPGLAALSGPHCSLRRPRPPLPHSLPCTEGGVGKTCLSSPASPPPPFPSQGCWERLRGVCRGLHGQAGRPAGGPVQTCRPVPPAPGSPPA